MHSKTYIPENVRIFNPLNFSLHYTLWGKFWVKYSNHFFFFSIYTIGTYWVHKFVKSNSNRRTLTCHWRFSSWTSSQKIWVISATNTVGNFTRILPQLNVEMLEKIDVICFENILGQFAKIHLKNNTKAKENANFSKRIILFMHCYFIIIKKGLKHCEHA